MSLPNLETIINRSPGETEFHQAVDEVFESVKPVLEKNPQYNKYKIFERMTEPERVISFRVTWVDDQGEVHVNRGYRVQMNSTIGPYKGGLRFHPSVNLSILKFLAFEQTFKNALTGIAMGGGKGGSDFNPRGKSDGEVMRFCQSFMAELSRHIGHRIDIPAGDIGVGAREIGYMFGAYKKSQNEFTGVLTGKGYNWGGSLIRPEATGYGLVYFAQNMLAANSNDLQGKKCLVSGAGNVAQFAMDKLIQVGAVPISASDSSGYIIDEEGMNREKLDFLKELKNVKRGRIKEYADKFPNVEYFDFNEGEEVNPMWKHTADCIFPCDTQNEIKEKDAHNIANNGVILLAEGANMPCTSKAISILLDKGILYAPGKASNAGGVGTSGLEMMQNYSGEKWSADKVDENLQNIMKSIHDTCLNYAKKYSDPHDYQTGANIAGFVKVADSMIEQGII